jgi:hypothetical protein
LGYTRLASFLIFALVSPAVAQIAILQVRVVEGEGGVHIPGSRARPITVEVTDETGRPVAAAAVSFHLPEDGPGGTFVNGLRTTIVTTDARGRAVVQTLQVNRTPGRFQIRIVVSKEQARAGAVSFQYIAEPGAIAPAPSTAARTSAPTSRNPLPAAAAPRSHSGWYVLAAAAAGGVVAGVLASGRSSKSLAATPPPPPLPTLTIGLPSIAVGKP